MHVQQCGVFLTGCGNFQLSYMLLLERFIGLIYGENKPIVCAIGQWKVAVVEVKSKHVYINPFFVQTSGESRL